MLKKCLSVFAIGVSLAVASPVLAGETIGPGGEKATPSSELTLSDAEAAKLKEGKYTAALLWHTSSDFVNAVTAGAKDEFARLGIEVVAQTDAGFDAAKQKSDVETILAKKPNAILALPLDPVTSAEAFKPAVAAGVKIVLLSNKPKDFVQGKDYVAIVTDDLFQMGKHAADALKIDEAPALDIPDLGILGLGGENRLARAHAASENTGTPFQKLVRLRMISAMRLRRCVHGILSNSGKLC